MAEYVPWFCISSPFLPSSLSLSLSFCGCLTPKLLSSNCNFLKLLVDCQYWQLQYKKRYAQCLQYQQFTICYAASWFNGARWNGYSLVTNQFVSDSHIPIVNLLPAVIFFFCLLLVIFTDREAVIVRVSWHTTCTMLFCYFHMILIFVFSLSFHVGSVVCVGSEWHQFPSSFFIPDYIAEVRWIDDGFRGLLPLPFNRTLGGTSAAPDYFNNKNRASDEQYVTKFWLKIQFLSLLF